MWKNHISSDVTLRRNIIPPTTLLLQSSICLFSLMSVGSPSISRTVFRMKSLLLFFLLVGIRGRSEGSWLMSQPFDDFGWVQYLIFFFPRHRLMVNLSWQVYENTCHLLFSCPTRSVDSLPDCFNRDCLTISKKPSFIIIYATELVKQLGTPRL